MPEWHSLFIHPTNIWASIFYLDTDTVLSNGHATSKQNKDSCPHGVYMLA